MLERLTASEWSGWVGVAFRASGLPEPVTLRLETVTRTGSPLLPGGREPFALAFRGPVSELLPQAIYRLESEVVEPLEIFLVPVARDSQGISYEAIFT